MVKRPSWPATRRATTASVRWSRRFPRTGSNVP